jgi:hypothetical protein
MNVPNNETISRYPSGKSIFRSVIRNLDENEQEVTRALTNSAAAPTPPNTEQGWELDWLPYGQGLSRPSQNTKRGRDASQLRAANVKRKGRVAHVVNALNVVWLVVVAQY